jgi:hypothetical protein
MGRWSRRDTLTRRYLACNLYLYARSSPLAFIDALGNEESPVIEADAKMWDNDWPDADDLLVHLKMRYYAKCNDDGHVLNEDPPYNVTVEHAVSWLDEANAGGVILTPIRCKGSKGDKHNGMLVRWMAGTNEGDQGVSEEAWAWGSGAGAIGGGLVGILIGLRKGEPGKGAMAGAGGGALVLGTAGLVLGSAWEAAFDTEIEWLFGHAWTVCCKCIDECTDGRWEPVVKYLSRPDSWQRLKTNDWFFEDIYVTHSGTGMDD